MAIERPSKVVWCSMLLVEMIARQMLLARFKVQFVSVCSRVAIVLFFTIRFTITN